jgi:hypothetical protein
MPMKPLNNFRCNSFEGSDVCGIDGVTCEVTSLFNPHRHNWAAHFRSERA